MFIVLLNVNFVMFWENGNRCDVEGLIFSLGLIFLWSNCDLIFFDKFNIELLINFIGVEFLKVGSISLSLRFEVVSFGSWKFVINVICFFDVNVIFGVFGNEVLFVLN